jgi:hypothetical protein
MITPWYDEIGNRGATRLTDDEVREIAAAQPWRLRQYPEWAERLSEPPGTLPLPMALPPGTRCAWFAKCDRDATHIEPHPILSGVPACDRCPTIGRA